ncbi:MAG: (2Fe-2S)-binding protein [Acidobacteriota bacterium]
MAEQVRIQVDGASVEVPGGVSVAVALWTLVGPSGVRTSIDGEPRGPLCGMGTCFECRVTIDGRQHVRSCSTTVVEGMVVERQEAGL